MIRKLDITDRNVASRVLDVQLPAYRIEAVLIESDAIPALQDTVMSLTACDEIFYGYVDEDELCGVISYKLEDGVLDIHRLVVAPHRFREGIARALLRHLLALNAGNSRVIVATGSKNLPALRLYESEQFVRQQEMEVVPGLWITELARALES